VRRLLVFGLFAVTLGVACSPAGSTGPVQATGSPTPQPTTSGEPSPTKKPPPKFEGRVAVIDGSTRELMTGLSWRSGCPVPIEDLRLLTLTHWGFDGRVHLGSLVVHEDEALPVVRVFRKLFRARFAIKRMELVDEYGADDDRSMAANNTSGFNCRSVTGGSGWSQHSYGWAIDINPIQNPYITSDGTVLPPEGAAYVDRSRTARGMIHDGDVVVRAFAAVGWEWGGNFQSIKDYQHFSATGG
jgi:hypothetical protein